MVFCERKASETKCWGEGEVQGIQCVPMPVNWLAVTAELGKLPILIYILKNLQDNDFHMGFRLDIYYLVHRLLEGKFVFH